jgi:TRAP transporter TAXI family solute receptor
MNHDAASTQSGLKKESDPLEHQATFGRGTLMELFDLNPAAATAALGVVILAVIAAIYFFVQSAPPNEVTITAGPEGSSFYKSAQKYAAILEKNGVTVHVMPSKGSYENLQRLSDPNSEADVGFAQVGITGTDTSDLLSLGSVSNQPILVFYRGEPIELLSDLKGKKISIGAPGTGTRNFATALLGLNGIKENEGTPLLDYAPEEAAQALLDKKIDAVFVMSESTSLDVVRKLMRSDVAHLFSFKQATAYSRKMDALNVLTLPQGAIDLGANIPSHDITLVGPTVELIAVENLHPALSDLLLEAASEVHARPGLFQKRGEFPAPIEHGIKISGEATRYYKSGKSFLYRLLPYWLASLLSRIVVVIIPLLVVTIPAIRSVPAVFRWRMQRRIHRRYRELLTLEHDLRTTKAPSTPEWLKNRFAKIEEGVDKMKVPASFADQFYALRGHIDYVRQLVIRRQGL